jgi:hypothetical protein
MVRSEGDMSLKTPVTPPVIYPGTVRLVAQRLSHYATPGPVLDGRGVKFTHTQTRTLAASSPRESTSVVFDNVSVWSPDLVWAFVIREKSPHSAWIRTPDRPPCTLDTIPTTL